MAADALDPRAEKLDQATALIDEVLATLDDGADICGACRSTRYRDFGAFKAAEALRGAKTRIERAADSLDDAAEADRRRR